LIEELDVGVLVWLFCKLGEEKEKREAINLAN